MVKLDNRPIHNLSNVDKAVTVADQRVTNNNAIQRTAMLIAVIRYLLLKTFDKFINLN